MAPRITYADHQGGNHVFVKACLTADEAADVALIGGPDVHIIDMGSIDHCYLIDFPKGSDSGQAVLVMLSLLNGGTIRYHP